MDSFLHYLGYGLGLAYFCIVMPYCNYEAVRKVFPKRKFPDPKPKKAPGPAPQRKPRKLYTENEAITAVGSRDRLIELVREEKVRVFKDKGEILISSADVDKSVPAKKKRSKHSYPVVSTFKEEHRITNPVEFHP